MDTFQLLTRHLPALENECVSFFCCLSGISDEKVR